MVTGAPSFFILRATYSKETPTPCSPAAASLQGLEPDFVYSAMFLCRRSRYSQPFASPIRCKIDTTAR
jgi:hypothetical protein